jgi:hypothetical protein
MFQLSDAVGKGIPAAAEIDLSLNAAGTALGLKYGG